MVSSYICYNGMTIWTCMSTDETPVGKNGDILQIMDTDKQYRFDGENNEWIGLQEGESDSMVYLYTDSDEHAEGAYKDENFTPFTGKSDFEAFVGNSPIAVISISEELGNTILFPVVLSLSETFGLIGVARVLTDEHSTLALSTLTLYGHAG